jgi:hypothetical protein
MKIASNLEGWNKFRAVMPVMLGHMTLPESPIRRSHTIKKSHTLADVGLWLMFANSQEN